MKRALALAALIAALAAPASASAYWQHTTYRVAWPSRFFGTTYTLPIPATSYAPRVLLDEHQLAPNTWTPLSCGSYISTDKALALVGYGRIELHLLTGWLCHYPTAGTVSTVDVLTWQQ